MALTIISKLTIVLVLAFSLLNNCVRCEKKDKKCPDGYSFQEGDKVGHHNEIKDTKLQNIVECATLCDETPGCKSIEWSPSRNHCIMLRAKNADGPQWQDYRFCYKNVDAASDSWVIGAGWCVDATGEEAGRNPDKYGLTENDCFKLCLTDTSLNGCASLDNNLCVTYTGDIKGSNGNFHYKCYYRTVDCVWGSYGEWSRCSKSCYQSRTRPIAKPASNGGQACEGNATETRTCSTDACRCWEQRNGVYVKEGHGQENECYATIEEAKSKCVAAGDCKAIATQNDICGGKFRVTHGAPTFIKFANWKPYAMIAYEDWCRSDYCGEDFAYHSGTMVNGNAPARSPKQCHKECASLSTCKFWDYGESTCRLRSNAGPKGLQEDRGFAYGSKNCLFVTHGQWSGWGGNSACTKTCGTGTQTRYRTCTNPPPSEGGKSCSGVSSEWQTCFWRHCQVCGPDCRVCNKDLGICLESWPNGRPWNLSGRSMAWNWQNGIACSLPHMTIVWESDNVDSFDAAKEDCAAACVARKDCKFAQVSRKYDGKLHTCVLNEECGETKDDASSHLFIKQ